VNPYQYVIQNGELKMNKQSTSNHQGIVGGVDTHKDLHFAAVVDVYDRVLANNSFPTTRHGYKSMLNWMQSFGEVKRIGVECTGTYGACLLWSNLSGHFVKILINLARC